jgi:hypothetical protein
MTSMEVKEVVDHPIKLRGTCMKIIILDFWIKCLEFRIKFFSFVFHLQ